MSRAFARVPARMLIERLAPSAAWVLCLAAFCFSTARAQSLEPRAYSNTPVGLNFLLAGYGYAEGSASFDPSVPITNAHLHSDNFFVGYSHTLDVWGDAAKFAVVLPEASLGGSALVAGRPRERDISGLGDPVFNFAWNFFGAPAMSLKEFQGYHQDLILGASLKITAPLGQYDPTKLVNIGNNRWSFKPELGLSKAVNSWTIDFYVAAAYYTENSDFLNGGTLQQDPLYSAQAHVMRNLPHNIWVALDGTFYWGGRTTVNDRRAATLQGASRFGATLALPINRYNSIKVFGAKGTTSRTGSNFNDVGIAWQYRWGAGL